MIKQMEFHYGIHHYDGDDPVQGIVQFHDCKQFDECKNIDKNTQCNNIQIIQKYKN